MKHAPAPPPAAQAVFGDRLPLAMRYAEHLASTGVQHGLLGPREVPRLWPRHLLNCAVLSDLIDPGAHVADLGSGAGLPGIALAVRRADLHLVLIEPLLRRAQWLRAVVADLGLEQVQVRRARADEVAVDLAVPVVVARAVAPLDRLAAWALPLLTPGGELLAMKGATVQEEVHRTRRAVLAAGALSTQILSVGAGLIPEAATVVRLRTPATRDRSARGRGSVTR